MTIEQIFKLIDAGFTKDEINALSAAPAGAAETGTQGVEQSDHIETPPATETAPQGENSAPQTQSNDAFNATVLNAISELTKSVQALQKTNQSANVRNMAFESQPREDAATVIARIIDPTFKK